MKPNAKLASVIQIRTYHLEGLPDDELVPAYPWLATASTEIVDMSPSPDLTPAGVVAMGHFARVRTGVAKAGTEADAAEEAIRSLLEQLS